MISGKLDEHFPLVVWQTGSGTQSNMNANEVISNRAIELAGGVIGSKKPDPPQRRRQQVAVVQRRLPDGDARRGGGADPEELLPAVAQLSATFWAKSKEYADIVKIGRTHLMDATPLTLGQEISGLRRAARLRPREHRARAMQTSTSSRSAGAPSARGSTLTRSTPRRSLRRSPTLTGLPFRTAPNKFAALAAHDAIVLTHGALKTLAVACMKIANDVRLLASGPRCGIGEHHHPGERARQLDHAGQGEPDPVRGDDDGRPPRSWGTT